MNCLTHQLEYIESWGERDSREPDIMWCNHMALVTVRILAKLRDQQKGACMSRNVGRQQRFESMQRGFHATVKIEA